MPRTQPPEAERKQRRAADRAFVQQAVEQLRSSDRWPRWLTTRRNFHSYSLHNPTGARAKARKASYAGRCARCGTRTSGAQGKSQPSRFGQRCKPQSRPRWTRETVRGAQRFWRALALRRLLRRLGRNACTAVVRSARGIRPRATLAFSVAPSHARPRVGRHQKRRPSVWSKSLWMK